MHQRFAILASGDLHIDGCHQRNRLIDRMNAMHPPPQRWELGPPSVADGSALTAEQIFENIHALMDQKDAGLMIPVSNIDDGITQRNIRDIFRAYNASVCDVAGTDLEATGECE